MKTIGIFDAKTHLPGICDEVIATGEPVTISRRGKPLVVLSPAPPAETAREDILSATKRWQASSPEGPDFPEGWRERSDKSLSPFDDEEVAP